MLAFTAEEAWLARWGAGDGAAEAADGSVHLLDFPFVPEGWKDDALAAKWARVREIRGQATQLLELDRKEGRIGSSLQARVDFGLAEPHAAILPAKTWEEVLIVSTVAIDQPPPLAGHLATGTAEDNIRVSTAIAPGTKCARCWRVLPEVGASAKHPTLCLRCEDAVEAQDAMAAQPA